jgi:NADPH-dependent curcumin reductase CurA
MANDVNRQWHLAAHPVGMVKESDFALREVPIPKPRDGQVLVRNLYLSVDPAMRGWITGQRTYVDGIQIGDLMRGACVGQVIESKKPGYEPGEFVVGGFDWQDYVATENGGMLPMTKIPPGVPITIALGPLGITGLTAYFGLLDVGKPQAGETVVVSGAAGATGSVVGQIAKIKGCRAIGIAGGAEKCAWLKNEAGFDAAIDYKTEDVAQRLKELCPDGVNVYFDNVGGPILDAALQNLALRGRVVICGAISTYNDREQAPGPRNYLQLLVNRGRMEGFIVVDYFKRIPEAVADLSQWVLSGKIKYKEDFVQGLENAPRALIRLFESKNFGKQLVKIADPPLGR